MIIVLPSFLLFLSLLPNSFHATYAHPLLSLPIVVHKAVIYGDCFQSHHIWVCKLIAVMVLSAGVKWECSSDDSKVELTQH